MIYFFDPPNPEKPMIAAMSGSIPSVATSSAFFFFSRFFSRRYSRYFSSYNTQKCRKCHKISYFVFTSSFMSDTFCWKLYLISFSSAFFLFVANRAFTWSKDERSTFMDIPRFL